MRKILNRVFMACYIVAALLLTGACNDRLDIQQVYPFSVETMPVPKKLKVGETAEIRCSLKREGRFEDARYTIRYFQSDGRGQLRLDNGTVLLPNDRYPLDRETFRLYYVAGSQEPGVIDLVFEDNAGQAAELSFTFNNDSSESGSTEDSGNEAEQE